MDEYNTISASPSSTKVTPIVASAPWVETYLKGIKDIVSAYPTLDLPKVFRFNSFLLELLEANSNLRNSCGILYSLLSAINSVIEISDESTPKDDRVDYGLRELVRRLYDEALRNSPSSLYGLDDGEGEASE